MIARINRIKNLGLVFSDYSGDTSLPALKRFNLVFGWNGCGKTTLSRLFDAIGGVSIPDLEYEIEDDSGNKYKQGGAFPKKIRVFNQDYIRANVRLLEGRANTISLVLGKENKELLEKIESDNRLLDGDPVAKTPGKLAVCAENEKDATHKSADRDGKFTEIAKAIGVAIGGNALRDYKRTQAERDFAAISVKAELSETDLNKYLVSAKQVSMQEVHSVLIPKIKLDEDSGEQEFSAVIDTMNEQDKTLLNRTVESEVIARLAANNDIARWVEDGVRLHQKHSSKVCEYCSQNVPNERVEQLARHFNEADKQLKRDLQILVQNLQTIRSSIEALRVPDKARFYAELQTGAETSISQFETEKNAVLTGVDNCIEELSTKKDKTTESLVPSKLVNANAFIVQVEEINKIITRHNDTTTDFENVKKDAAKKLKDHFLSTIYDDVNKLQVEIASSKQSVETSKKEIEIIRERIATNLAKISSTHKACEEINSRLYTFLGYQELKFVPRIEEQTGADGIKTEVTTGYDIMRGSEPATLLSEGEKTAIAFVYFVVHLGDQEFDRRDGMIVVDDPISSFDSNSLYQAFSFLKNAVKDAGQVFIFTHSFDFLKLLINWRKHAGGGGYYMIKNRCPDDVRCAYIDIMDDELYSYESEYHYLFKLLKQMRDEQNDSIAKAYPVPNIARKVWDTFLMFRVPNSNSTYKKMDELKASGYDEQKLDAIYKFTNDQSHITGAGFNPALVPETKKVVKELFEMMEEIAPEHYKILDQATT
jgi:wobble nucleotide-excising tRNase